jgi:hypothetical protein
MAATTTLLGLVTPTQGTLSGTWGDTVNYGISDYVDIAIAGTLSFAGDGPITLTNTTGSASGNGITSTTAQYMVIRVTGTLTTPKIITGPSYSKLYMVDNSATGSTVSFIRAGQTPAVSVAVGEKCFVYYNGTDYVKVASSIADGVTTIDFGSTGLTPATATSGAVTVAGTLAVANGGTGLTAGTSGGVPYYSASGVIASSAALAAGALVVGGGAGTTPATTTTGTGVVTALGTNVGTAGAFVVNGGALGTPSSGTLTNATGLPLTTGVTGILPVANGGTATATPSLVQGSGVTITGTWPNQTIAATGSGGTVTAVSVVSANGFAGTSSGGTTPALTLSTSITGILKGDATAISAATSGTDYLAPPSGTAILKANSGGALANATAGTDYVAPGTATTFTAKQTFSGTSSNLAVVLNDAAEVATVSATAATGTINYDVTTQSVLYYTSNATGNWTLNVRASSGATLDSVMSIGQSVTIAFLVTQGSTAYYQTAFDVDGNGQTMRWIGGAPTAGNANGIDSYRYLIIKTTSGTFTVLASVTQFKA